MSFRFAAASRLRLQHLSPILKHLVHNLENLLRHRVLFQQMAQVQNRRIIMDPSFHCLDPCKVTEAGRIDQHLLHQGGLNREPLAAAGGSRASSPKESADDLLCWTACDNGLNQGQKRLLGNRDLHLIKQALATRPLFGVELLIESPLYLERTSHPVKFSSRTGRILAGFSGIPRSISMKETAARKR